MPLAIPQTHASFYPHRVFFFFFFFFFFFDFWAPFSFALPPPLPTFIQKALYQKETIWNNRFVRIDEKTCVLRIMVQKRGY